MQYLDVGRQDALAFVQKFYAEAGVRVVSARSQAFPEETIIVADVREADFEKALGMSQDIEKGLPEAYIVVVRKAKNYTDNEVISVKTVKDVYVSELVELLNERSRTSEHQPSLEYIRDAAENIRISLTRRHHLIFGRRGVGKTALLLEARQKIEQRGDAILWMNVQILRGLDAERAFLNIGHRLCELAFSIHQTRTTQPVSVQNAKTIKEEIVKLLQSIKLKKSSVSLIVPRLQNFVSLFCAEIAKDIFIFVDDLHYLETKEQPHFLDYLHGVTRDNPAWLKIAGIRNQCRVYRNTPPTGLEPGHDAAEINLDITLEEPKKARTFLVEVISTYIKAANISSRSGFLPTSALDRLVLASGGVPRDFLVLAARSIQIARTRNNARVVGIQDVNEAASEAGNQKLADLEEDATASQGQYNQLTRALQALKSRVIDEYHFSFFRVGIKDKISNPDQYKILQALMDLRMIHLIKASLSDAHVVGQRFEVYMIDLSQFSVSRLRHNLSVLELRGGALVLRTTGANAKTIVADTPRKVVQVLRTSPELRLSEFS